MFAARERLRVCWHQDRLFFATARFKTSYAWEWPNPRANFLVSQAIDHPPIMLLFTHGVDHSVGHHAISR